MTPRTRKSKAKKHPLEDKDVDLVNPFVVATLNVLKTMAATDSVPGKPTVKNTLETFGVVTGIIGMASNGVNGNLLISFDEKSILAIVNRMLMEQFHALNQDIIDAVGEITNMICGGAKKDLSEMGISFDMATPMVITGKGLELQQMSQSPILNLPFTTPEGQFVVKTNLHCNEKLLKDC